jgi:predicted DNA-binding transcriptional regulator YafY
VWTAGAWCELRNDFRSFRPDRILELVLAEHFTDEPGKDLATYLRALEADWWPEPRSR